MTDREKLDLLFLLDRATSKIPWWHRFDSDIASFGALAALAGVLIGMVAAASLLSDHVCPDCAAARRHSLSANAQTWLYDKRQPAPNASIHSWTAPPPAGAFEDGSVISVGAYTYVHTNDNGWVQVR